MSKSVYLDNKILEAMVIDFKLSKKQKFKYEFILEDIKIALSNGNKSFQLQQIEVEYKTIKYTHEDIYIKLANSFLTLASNILRCKRFNFVDFDDAIQEFVMICFEKIDKYDPCYIGKNGKKSKAFNYMTTCIINHYKQLYRTARNYNEFKRKYQDNLQFANKSGRVIKNKKREEK